MKMKRRLSPAKIFPSPHAAIPRIIRPEDVRRKRGGGGGGARQLMQIRAVAKIAAVKVTKMNLRDRNVSSSRK